MSTGTEMARRPAADLSQEEWQDRVERTHQLDQQIKTGLLAGRVAWWATASAVYEFHQEGGITLLLGADTSVDEYCAQPDVAITKQRYMEFFHAWRQVQLSGLSLDDVQDVPWAKLIKMFRAINDGKLSFRKALDEARSLSLTDIGEKYLSKPSKSNRAQSARADEPDPTEGKKAAGPDEGTGDEVGEPIGYPNSTDNLATSTETPSGHDAEDEDEPVVVGTSTGAVSAPESTEDFGEPEDAEPVEAAETAPQASVQRPQDGQGLADAEERTDVIEASRKLEIKAGNVVRAYNANSNPTKNIPKPLREAVIALADAMGYTIKQR